MVALVAKHHLDQTACSRMGASIHSIYAPGCTSSLEFLEIINEVKVIFSTETRKLRSADSPLTENACIIWMTSVFPDISEFKGMNERAVRHEVVPIKWYVF